MSLLSEVCLVIDFEGFHVANQFRVREFGMHSMNRNRMSYSFRFDLTDLKPLVTEKDWRTINYCTRFVHGLSFFPGRAESFLYRPSDLESLVVREWKHSREKCVREYVAFKGGHVEKDLLEKLDIPYINLEDYGCPKFEKLPVAENVKSCKYHVNAAAAMGKRKPHCPMVECATFADWIRNEELSLSSLDVS